jgi:hypothetical protein
MSDSVMSQQALLGLACAAALVLPLIILAVVIVLRNGNQVTHR